MNYRAQAKYVHMAPRKTRLLVDLVRGLSIDEARRQLMFSKKAAAEPVLKVLNSAIANAKNNFNADITDFRVVEAFVDEGSKFKRFKPRAHGRATPIRKRMSHITIVVGTKMGKEIKEITKAKKEEKSELPVAKKTVNKSSATTKKAVKTSEKKTAKKK